MSPRKFIRLGGFETISPFYKLRSNHFRFRFPPAIRSRFCPAEVFLERVDFTLLVEKTWLAAPIEDNPVGTLKRSCWRGHDRFLSRDSQFPRGGEAASTEGFLACRPPARPLL